MSWYKKYLRIYDKPFHEVPEKILQEIRKKIVDLQSDSPLVTVSVIGYNEEKHLPACLWSLSDMQCKYPVEVIGVDNDSQDRTGEIFQVLNIPCTTERQHSCGFARLCGLQKARGKYHINIDSDTLYPPCYVETMVRALQQKNVVAASALWSYFPDKKHSRLGLIFYETARDIYLFLQSFKRPELSVRGLVFAYHTDYARRAGIRTDIRRGEDGSLAFGLKEYGKIVFVRNRKARAITGYGTVGTDGSLLNSFKIRTTKALKNTGGLFTQKKEYKDTKDNLI